ncbi:MAG: AIR synthase-related protein, partial [Mariprofundales bacterium]|nr:AIR synthase-related protein [Mariprofundales bacterium]
GDAARKINTPIVGGNVSLYNDSEEYLTTIPPTPSLAMLSKTTNLKHLPENTIQKEGETIILIGETKPELGGSEHYHILNTPAAGSTPTIPDDIDQRLNTIVQLVRTSRITTAHDVSNGGLATALSELITPTHGANITLTGSRLTDTELLFSETHGRMLLITPAPEQVLHQLQNTPHAIIGTTTSKPQLHITTKNQQITLTHEEIQRATQSLTRTMKE